MSLISPSRVLHDHFLDSNDHVRVGQLAWILPGLVTAGFVVGREVRITNAAFLLAATSILAGMTFTMTVTFWNKSLDARRDPSRALQGDILKSIDGNLQHLVWTVLVGVASTAFYALVALFADPAAGAPVWASAVCAGLLIYLITLVGLALHRFAEAALTLR